jgi:hypothetical protein
MIHHRWRRLLLGRRQRGRHRGDGRGGEDHDEYWGRMDDHPGNARGNVVANLLTGGGVENNNNAKNNDGGVMCLSSPPPPSVVNGGGGGGGGRSLLSPLASSMPGDGDPSSLALSVAENLLSPTHGHEFYLSYCMPLLALRLVKVLAASFVSVKCVAWRLISP